MTTKNVGNLSLLSPDRDDRGRVKMGSRLELQYSVIENNYYKPRSELAAVLGCTGHNISVLKRKWRESGRMAEFILSEFLRYKDSDRVSEEVKFTVVAKMLMKLIEMGYIVPSKGDSLPTEFRLSWVGEEKVGTREDRDQYTG